jgi:hypothetical protein
VHFPRSLFGFFFLGGGGRGTADSPCKLEMQDMGGKNSDL